MEQENKSVESTEKPLTFEEMLGKENYQSEFDKRIAKALETAKTKWEDDAKAKQTEAEKLAKMKEDEKHQYELNKANERAEEAIAKLNAYELKNTAIKIAQEKGLDISLLEDIDYSKQTAETITTIIDTKKAVFDKAIEKAMNEKYKEESPLNVQHSTTTQTKTSLPEFF